MSPFLMLWIWLGSVVAAAIIGHSRRATLSGLLLGVFLGPIGIAAALALDGRAACPHCAGKLDGRGRICQHCRRPIRWNEEAPATERRFWGFRRGSPQCPHCGAALEKDAAQCPACRGGITWARGAPIKVSRDDGAAPPPPRPTEQPWSQFRKLR